VFEGKVFEDLKHFGVKILGLRIGDNNQWQEVAQIINITLSIHELAPLMLMTGGRGGSFKFEEKDWGKVFIETRVVANRFLSIVYLNEGAKDGADGFEVEGGGHIHRMELEGLEEVFLSEESHSIDDLTEVGNLDLVEGDKDFGLDDFTQS
jgi:hypothetical protein